MKTIIVAWALFTYLATAPGLTLHQRLVDLPHGLYRSLACSAADARRYAILYGKGSQSCDVFLGYRAGWTNLGSRNILVGKCTATPTPDTSNFVNIANKLCFWRTSGERVVCPTPEPGCEKEK